MKLDKAYIIDGDVIEKSIKEREEILEKVDERLYPRYKRTIETELAVLKDFKQHLKPALPIVEESFDSGSNFALKNRDKCFTDEYETNKQTFLTKDF